MTPFVRSSVWALLAATVIAVGVLAIRSAGGDRTGPPPLLHEAGSFALTNELGRRVASADLRGTVVVANVIFSRCPAQCHRLSLAMAGLQRQIPEGVRLVSLTADPGYDTPEVLARYGVKYRQDPARWTFLTGNKAELYGYATTNLLFSVLENPDPQHAALEDLFIHSMDFALLDRAGRLRAVVHSDAPGAQGEILSLVRRLLREPYP